MTLSIFTVFLAGFITILSPCILPILPPFLATSLKQSKWKPLFITLGLMFGFTIVGVAISAFGQALGVSIFTFRKIAIVLLFIFGLGLLLPQYSALVLGRLEYYIRSLFPKRNNSPVVENKGVLSGFFTGMGLGFAWIPCVGPVYGAVLTFAASRQSIGLSILYFLIYSLGAGIPLLLLAFFSNKLVNKFRWLATRAETFKKVAGAILILVAISFVFNWDQAVQTWILQFYPNFAL